MDHQNLDEIMAVIEDGFGAEAAFTSGPLKDTEVAALNSVFGDAGYQDYVQDETNRYIVRNYLLNAFVLGYLDEGRLRELCDGIDNPAQRASLALQMLMSSVEQATDLSLELANEVPPDDPEAPHLRLVHP